MTTIEAAQRQAAITKLKNNPPAFPVLGQTNEAFRGMTLRDYFAAKAMQGFAADDSDGWKTLDHMAGTAYRWADAMLKARND